MKVVSLLTLALMDIPLTIMEFVNNALIIVNYAHTNLMQQIMSIRSALNANNHLFNIILYLVTTLDNVNHAIHPVQDVNTLLLLMVIIFLLPDPYIKHL